MFLNIGWMRGCLNYIPFTPIFSSYVGLYLSSATLCSFVFYRSSHRRCSIKKVFLKISQSSQENTCPRASFLITLQAWGVFLCILQSFKNTFFTEHLRWLFLILPSASFILCWFKLFNPFVPNASFLYPLKTSENFKKTLQIFYVFRG